MISTTATAPTTPKAQASTRCYPAPNGWRVSGEPGRAERATRVRCTRVLGGEFSTGRPETPLDVITFVRRRASGEPP